ncbi:hypothetical protein C8R47DRAFT_1066111 [Mycena vitilis]|nr:hypothetical protein C8R47DRAFT_1066111 [Mycena vitilis]
MTCSRRDSVLDNIPNEIMDVILSMFIRDSNNHIIYIIRRMRLSMVSFRFRNLVLRNPMNWNVVVMARCIKPEFVKLCLSRAKRNLDLSINTRTFKKVRISHKKAKLVRSVPAKDFVTDVTLLLEAVVPQVTSLRLVCLQSHEAETLSLEILRFDTNNIRSILTRVLFPCSTIGDNTSKEGWSAVTHLNFEGVGLMLFGSRPYIGLTSLRLSAVESRMSIPWSTYRDAFKASAGLQVLEMEDVVCVRFEGATAVTLPHLTHLLFRCTNIKGEEDSAGVLRSLRAPSLQVLCISLGHNEDLGQIIEPCSHFLRTTERIELAGTLSMASGERLRRVMRAVRELDLRCVRYSPLLDIFTPPTEEDTLALILVRDHIAPREARRFLDKKNIRRIITGRLPTQAEWTLCNEELLCRDITFREREEPWLQSTDDQWKTSRIREEFRL